MGKDLSQIYWDVHGIEGVDLEEFLSDVKEGRYGNFTPTQIRDFLITVEASIIENIETKAAEAPPFAAAKEQLIAETTARFASLRERFTA